MMMYEPRPVKTEWTTQQVRTTDPDGKVYFSTLLTISTPTGIFTTFWPGGSGRALADELKRLANMNQAGIQVKVDVPVEGAVAESNGQAGG